MESINSDSHQINENLVQVKDFIENFQLEPLLQTDPDLKLKPYLHNDFTYIQDEEALKQFSKDILQNHKYIGVDIEQTNKHTYQGSICLIQIATIYKNYIIDVIALRDVVKNLITPIFQDKNIVKIFYAGGSDLQWLNRDYGIFVVNVFDVYNASSFLEKNRDHSLAALVEQYCKHPIDKKKKKEFQTSDWYHRPLTEEQLNYAIIDAHYLIYLRNVLLQKLKVSKEIGAIAAYVKQMQHPCTKPYESRAFNLKQCLDFFDKEIGWYKDNDETFAKRIQITGQGKDKRIFLTLCKLRDDIAREVDKSADQISHLKTLLAMTIENMNIAYSKEEDGLFVSDEIFSLPKSAKPAAEKIFKGEGLIDSEELDLRKKQEISKEDKKLERRKIVEEKFTLKKSPYENCEILAPDGTLISRTNKKKVKWYLEKGLGTLVKEDPPTVKLNFEPKSRNAPYVASFDVDRELYLKHHRLNRCVVCGQEESLSRFHIVPSLYRQHLPLKVKDHNAHDILITCFRCQEKAHGEADKRKSEVAKKFDVPLIHFDKSHDIKLSVATVQKHLATLKKHKEVMTKHKIQKLKKLIRDDFVIIQKSESLNEETKKILASFKYKENGDVKIDESVHDYFENIKTFKQMVESASNKDFQNLHGKLVVDKLKTMEEVSEFIEDWRMFFIDTMDPQFLPHDWHVVLQKKAHLIKNVNN